MLPRKPIAVTGACLATRRAVYDEIGGADPRLPVAFSDMDLCLRAARHGYRVVWTPEAQLTHVKGASRGDGEAPANLAREAEAFATFRRVWADTPEPGLSFNPDLDFGPKGTVMPVQPWRPV